MLCKQRLRRWKQMAKIFGNTTATTTPIPDVAPLKDGISEGSIQSGNSTAGGKGYKLTAFTNNGDGTGVCTLRTVEGLKVGMECALQVNCACVGSIIAIDGLHITLDGILENAAMSEATEGDTIENYFIVIGEPQFGDIDVGLFAVALGKGGIAQNAGAVSLGKDNIVILPHGVALGRKNLAGYAALSAGYMNAVYADMGFASGHLNTVCMSAKNGFISGRSNILRGYAGHVEGGYNVVEHDYGHGEGYGTKAIGWCQHVQGLFNIPDEAMEYLHIVGNGEAEDKRSNAHTVSRSGDGWFARALYIGGNSQKDGAKKVATEDQIAEAKESAAAVYRAVQNLIVTEVKKGAAGNSVIIGGWGNSIPESGIGGIILGGEHNKVNGVFSVAGGNFAEANRDVTLAFGEYVSANASRATALGNSTTADTADQVVHGRYNKKDTDKAHIVGGGTSKDDRKNIYALDWNGNGEFAGAVKAGRQTTDEDNELVLVTKGYLKAYVDAAVKAALKG